MFSWRSTKGSLEQSPLASQCYSFVTILHVQLVIDASRLCPDGVDRDHELGSDFCIREASRTPPQDFALAVS